MTFNKIRKGLEIAVGAGALTLAALGAGGCKARYAEPTEKDRANLEIVADQRGIDAYNTNAGQVMAGVYSGLAALSSDEQTGTQESGFNFDKYEAALGKDGVANAKLLRKATQTGGRAIKVLDAAYVNVYSATNRLSKDIRAAGGVDNKKAKTLYEALSEKNKHGFMNGLAAIGDYNKMLHEHPEINPMTMETLKTRAKASGNQDLIDAVERLVSNYDATANGIYAGNFIIDSVQLTEGYTPAIVRNIEAENRIKSSYTEIDQLREEGPRVMRKVGVTNEYLAKQLKAVKAKAKRNESTDMDDIVNKIRYDIVMRLNSAGAKRDGEDGKISGEEWLAGVAYVDHKIGSTIMETRPEGMGMRFVKGVGRQLAPLYPGIKALDTLRYSVRVPDTLEEAVLKQYPNSAEPMRLATYHAILARMGAQNLPNLVGKKGKVNKQAGWLIVEQAAQALWMWQTVNAAVNAHGGGGNGGSGNNGSTTTPAPDPWTDG